MIFCAPTLPVRRSSFELTSPEPEPEPVPEVPVLSAPVFDKPVIVRKPRRPPSPLRAKSYKEETAHMVREEFAMLMFLRKNGPCNYFKVIAAARTPTESKREEREQGKLLLKLFGRLRTEGKIRCYREGTKMLVEGLI